MLSQIIYPLQQRTAFQQKGIIMSENIVNVSFITGCRPAETSGLILAQQLVLSGLLAALVEAGAIERGQAEDIIRIATFRNDFVCDSLLTEGGPSAPDVEKIRQHCLHALNLMYDDL
jgi:hypothetical protein